MARFGYPLTVPPVNPGEAPDHWQTMGASLLDPGHAGMLHPAVTNFAAMATAYRQHKPEGFNQAVASLPSVARPAVPEGAKKRPRRVLLQ